MKYVRKPGNWRRKVIFSSHKDKTRGDGVNGYLAYLPESLMMTWESFVLGFKELVRAIRRI